MAAYDPNDPLSDGWSTQRAGTEPAPTASTSLGDPGSEIVAATTASNYAAPDTALHTVPGLQIIVPANSGPAELALVGGWLLNLTTGTNANTVKLSGYVRIVDEAAAIVAYSPFNVMGTTTSQTLLLADPLGCLIPTAAVDKTFHVEMQFNQQGTLSAAATFVAAAPYPSKTLRAIRR